MTFYPKGRKGTNLLSYSEDFSQWFATGITRTNAGNASIYEANQTTISDFNTSVTSQLRVLASDIAGYSDKNITRCFSLFVLKDSVLPSTRWGALRIIYTEDNVTASGGTQLRFDTNSGDIYNADFTGAVTVDYGADDFDDYWRFWVSSYANKNFLSVNIYPANGKNLLSSTQDVSVTGSITCFGAQLELGDKPSNYEKTEGLSSWSAQSDNTTSWVTQNDVSTTWVNQ
jgi:hypothetical protein